MRVRVRVCVRARARAPPTLFLFFCFLSLGGDGLHVFGCFMAHPLPLLLGMMQVLRANCVYLCVSVCVCVCLRKLDDFQCALAS